MNPGNLEILLALGCALAAAAVGGVGCVGFLVWLAGGDPGTSRVRPKNILRQP